MTEHDEQVEPGSRAQRRRKATPALPPSAPGRTERLARLPPPTSPPDPARSAPSSSRASAAASAAAWPAASTARSPSSASTAATFDGRPKDIQHHQFDIRRKKTQDVFRQRQLSAVVHLGVMHDPRVTQAEHHSWNVAGFQRLLEFVAQYEVPKLIVLSSANVYGPRPDNPQFLGEDAPLLGGAAFSEIRDLIEVDMLAQSFFWKRPQTETVILRPVHILGGVRNAPSNYLRLKAIPTLLGFDPMVQVIHQDDVVSAIVRAYARRARHLQRRRPAPAAPLPLHCANRTPARPDPAPPRHRLVQTLWRGSSPPSPRPARPHPLRLHGRRPPRARGVRPRARARHRGDGARRRRSVLT